jgi:dinuclear metal center YbgI/SA1388 family protein
MGGLHSLAMPSPELTADRLSEWVELVHRAYPPGDAAEWDQVGTHVGAPDDAVGGVLVCLDVTEEVVDEAVAVGADLLLAHHPLFFRALPRLTPDTAAGRIALHAARSRRAIVAAHTNFDVAVGGTSDPMVDLLGLTGVRPLRPSAAPVRSKLVTFVPTEATGEVLAAMSDAGAGTIGEYTSCSFRVTGTGTFRPSARANPATGQRQRLNEVVEDRLEVLVDHGVVDAVVTALVDAHPYEEVAYDLVPVTSTATSSKGLGRVGSLPEPLALGEIARTVARELPSPHLRLAGNPDALVTRVAVCGGAGDSLIDAARGTGAELYITGDLRHHPTLDARTQGLALIDAGHYWTETAALPRLVAHLGELASGRGLSARLIASTTRTDPWVHPDELWVGRRATTADREGTS